MTTLKNDVNEPNSAIVTGKSVEKQSETAQNIAEMQKLKKLKKLKCKGCDINGTYFVEFEGRVYSIDEKKKKNGALQCLLRELLSPEIEDMVWENIKIECIKKGIIEILDENKISPSEVLEKLLNATVKVKNKVMFVFQHIAIGIEIYIDPDVSSEESKTALLPLGIKIVQKSKDSPFEVVFLEHAKTYLLKKEKELKNQDLRKVLIKVEGATVKAVSSYKKTFKGVCIPLEKMGFDLSEPEESAVDMDPEFTETYDTEPTHDIDVATTDLTKDIKKSSSRSRRRVKKPMVEKTSVISSSEDTKPVVAEPVVVKTKATTKADTAEKKVRNEPEPLDFTRQMDNLFGNLDDEKDVEEMASDEEYYHESEGEDDVEMDTAEDEESSLDKQESENIKKTEPFVSGFIDHN